MKLVLMVNLVSCYFQEPEVFGLTTRCSRTRLRSRWSFGAAAELGR